MIDYTLEDLKALWEKSRSEVAQKQIYKDYFATKSIVEPKIKPIVTKMEQELKDLESFLKFVEAKIEKYVEKK